MIVKDYVEVVVYIDGGARPTNPGPSGCGIVVKDALDQRVLAQSAIYLGEGTNNAAEYVGLIQALELVRALGARRVLVRSDSRLVVEQMKGAWRVREETLRPLWLEARALTTPFVEIEFEWIPRESNTAADALATTAIAGAYR